MALSILQYPHPFLSQKAREVTEITPDLCNLAKEMLELMYENRGLGLAATQVGQDCRLVVVDISGPENRSEPLVLVNPRIVSREGDVESEEGCLSVASYRTDVRRAEKVKLVAKDLQNQDIEIEGDGLMAICLQHELDHLDGVLFIDHISRLKRALYDKRVKKWTKRKKKD